MQKPSEYRYLNGNMVFAASIPVLRGCPLLTRLSKGGPTAHTLKIDEFGQSFEQIFLRKVELQVL